MKYLVDTCSLMNNLPDIHFEEVIVSTLVLRELEKHKSSHFPDKAYAARQALRMIEDKHSVITFDYNQYPALKFLSSDYDPSYTDNRLLEALFTYQNNGESVGLLSDDLALRLQAKSFGFKVKTAGEDAPERYQGTITISAEDPRTCLLYEMENQKREVENLFGNEIGEYILLSKVPKRRSVQGETIVGAWKWTGENYERIGMNQAFNSSCFNDVRPKNWRQAVAMDSLQYNPLTAITGKAGCGKSYLAISYIMQQIERHDKKVFIVTNNVPLRGTNTFGLRKGDLVSKILQSNLGSILKTKLGLTYTQLLIQQERINLIALEDIRGASIDGIVYITEVQNYSKDMLKTVLERMESGGQVIFDGDERQIDTALAKGANNGLDRMLEIFKGSGYLGHVELQGNIRGGISQLAEKM